MIIWSSIMGREWSLDMGYDNMKFNNGKGIKSRYGRDIKVWSSSSCFKGRGEAWSITSQNVAIITIHSVFSQLL